MAARITLEGCSFGFGASILRTFSLPSLRALALVNCTQEETFLDGLSGEQMPRLVALMIKDGRCAVFALVDNFVQRLGPLRELITHGTSVDIKQAATITHHASTLELLSIRCRAEPRDYSAWASLSNETVVEILQSLSEIRHLQFWVQGFHTFARTGKMKYPDYALRIAKASFSKVFG